MTNRPSYQQADETRAQAYQREHKAGFDAARSGSPKPQGASRPFLIGWGAGSKTH